MVRCQRLGGVKALTPSRGGGSPSGHPRKKQFMELLYGKHLRNRLADDMKDGGPLDIFVYNMELAFFEELFGQYANRNKVSILCDYRMKSLIGMFLYCHDQVIAKHWHKNGMLHMKVMVFPAKNVVYLGSHNFTWFAWHAAQNLTLRVESVPLTTKVKERFDYLWCKAVGVAPLAWELHSNRPNERREQDPSGVSFGGDPEPDSLTSYRVSET